MSNFIENPISHPDWNPNMGDFFSQRVFEEDRQHEKNELKKKILITSLISVHMIMLGVVFLLFS